MNNPNMPHNVLEITEEKQNIKKRAKFIGLALIITVVITFSWASIFMNITSSLGMTEEGSYNLLMEPAMLQLVNQVLSSVMFTLPFLIVLSGLGLRLFDVMSFSKPDKTFLAPIILIAVAFCGFANAGTTAIQNVFFSFGIDIAPPNIEEPSGLFGKVLVFAGAVIVAPLAEEFAMRGIVMGSLRKFGDNFAVIVSAILFGLMHGNLVQIPFAFVVGLALGYAVIKTGSITTGILIHFINNFLATVLSWVSESFNSDYMSQALYAFYLAFCLVLAFIGVYLLKDKSREFLKETTTQTKTPEKESIKIFFKSPLIILYIVLIAFETLLNYL